MVTEANAPVEYWVYRAGDLMPAEGTHLVLRLDEPENDLERLVAAIFADLTQNDALGAVIKGQLERITGRQFPPGIPAGAAIYAGGKDAGLATGPTR